MNKSEINIFMERSTMLKINEASWDRIVRVVLGIVLLSLGWGGVVTGGLGVFLKIIDFVPLLTGLVG